MSPKETEDKGTKGTKGTKEAKGAKGTEERPKSQKAVIGCQIQHVGKRKVTEDPRLNDAQALGS